MKKLLLIIVCFTLTLQLAAQGVTKYGQNTLGPSNDFVDKNGKTGSEPMLDINGQRLIDIVTSQNVTNITSSSAIASFTINASSTPLTDFGMCWGTSTNPLYNTPGSYVSWVENGSPATGPMPFSFGASMTPLSASQVYYVRVFAINGSGVHYGNEVTFTTLAAPLSALDAPSAPLPSSLKIIILK